MIATSYAYCKRNGYILTLSQLPEYISGSILTNILSKVKQYMIPIPPKEYELWDEPHFHYAEIPPGKSCIHGFFQSSKYFSDISGEIRELFNPPIEFKESVRAKYEYLFSDIQNTVVVHVRRGDYTNNTLLNICKGTVRYYINAMKIVSEKIKSPKYVIFSDDIAWCKSQDLFHSCTIIDEKDPEISLYLMTCFKNFIMTNSTFSWWGAWLADASIVVAPDIWFLHGITDYQDVYEPSWILCSID